MSSLMTFGLTCRCKSEQEKVKITGSLVLGDAKREEPLIVVTPAGAMHLHDVVVTTHSQMTVRAAIARAWNRIPAVAAVRAFTARHVDDLDPIETEGSDLAPSDYAIEIAEQTGRWE